MQWDAGPNAGFSTAPAARLALPVIDDPIYGYQQINVQAQRAASDSLLNQIIRLLRVRRQHPTFGRGNLQLLATPAPALLAYLRQGDETLLVVNNLSSEPQAILLDLPGLPAGKLLDLLSGETLTAPRLQLAGYGYRWLKLAL
jgi:maltose alpha-D-glucosyltransferase/alpha-amylase